MIINIARTVSMACRFHCVEAFVFGILLILAQGCNLPPQKYYLGPEIPLSQTAELTGSGEVKIRGIKSLSSKMSLPNDPIGSARIWLKPGPYRLLLDWDSSCEDGRARHYYRVRDREFDVQLKPGRSYTIKNTGRDVITDFLTNSCFSAGQFNPELNDRGAIRPYEGK